MFPRLFLFLLFTGSFLSTLYGQRTYPHALSIGVTSGAAKVSFLGSDLSTAAMGLDFSHQRNFTDFFSLRNSLGLGFILPTSYKLVEDGGLPETGGTTVLYDSRSTVLTLTINPMYYYRDKGFSLFFGLGGGAGLAMERYGAYFSNNGGQSKSEAIYNRKDFTPMLGWKPTIGVVFKVGSSQSPAEVELSVFREEWYIYNWFGLCMAYRFNFMQG